MVIHFERSFSVTILAMFQIQHRAIMTTSTFDLKFHSILKLRSKACGIVVAFLTGKSTWIRISVQQIRTGLFWQRRVDATTRGYLRLLELPSLQPSQRQLLLLKHASLLCFWEVALSLRAWPRSNIVIVECEDIHHSYTDQTHKAVMDLPNKVARTSAVLIYSCLLIRRENSACPLAKRHSESTEIIIPSRCKIWATSTALRMP